MVAVVGRLGVGQPERAQIVGSPSGLPRPHCTNFAFAVLGDLHMAPDKQMQLFNKAQARIREHLMKEQSKSGGPGTCHIGLVQLGDLGDYHHLPGSRACFERSKEWLDQFELPVGLITGNHDLEGPEFETDAENLQAWREVGGVYDEEDKAFHQNHFWRADVGPATFIGLGTSRFRGNPHCVHEVWIDDGQLAWFKRQLDETKERPVIVFSHAPILGSRLKVVHRVHVRSRCAYLNHSKNPGVFMELVRAHPNICLWFSGHFHLSHNYPDSISVVENTTFVTTGVIGKANRDGFRQSRLLVGSSTGYQLYTIDHNSGQSRLDLARDWPSLETRLDEQSKLQPVSSTALDAWRPVGDAGEELERFLIGNGALLARQEGMLVEYDIASQSAVGVACLQVEPADEILLRDAAGQRLEPEEGSDAATVEIVHKDDEQGDPNVRVIHRNSAGTFYQIFEGNKWRQARNKAKRTVGV